MFYVLQQLTQSCSFWDYGLIFTHTIRMVWLINVSENMSENYYTLSVIQIRS